VLLIVTKQVQHISSSRYAAIMQWH